MKPQEGRRCYVDFLKAVSAIVLMTHHYPYLVVYEVQGRPKPLLRFFAPIYSYGYVLVELFFILSGFLLTQRYYSSGRKTQGLETFMGKKFVRLYPGYFFTSCICICLQLFSHFKAGGLVLGLGTNLANIFLDLTVLKGGIFGSAVPLNVPAWFLTPLFVCYCFFWIIFHKKEAGGVDYCSVGPL